MTETETKKKKWCKKDQSGNVKIVSHVKPKDMTGWVEVDSNVYPGHVLDENNNIIIFDPTEEEIKSAEKRDVANEREKVVKSGFKFKGLDFEIDMNALTDLQAIYDGFIIKGAAEAMIGLSLIHI